MLFVTEQEIEKKKTSPQLTKQITTFYEIINCTATSVWYKCIILFVMITGVPTIQNMLARYHSSNIDMPVVNRIS